MKADGAFLGIDPKFTLYASIGRAKYQAWLVLCVIILAIHT